MANLNDAQITTFDNGGTVEFGTGNPVLNIVRGTLQVTPGLRRRLDMDTDAGAALTVQREGEDQPTEVRLSVKFTQVTGEAADLDSILRAQGTTGAVPAFDLVIKNPDYRGATTGQSLTLGDTICLDYSRTTGDQHDTLAVTLRYPGVCPAWASYGGV